MREDGGGMVGRTVHTVQCLVWLPAYLTNNWTDSTCRPGNGSRGRVAPPIPSSQSQSQLNAITHQTDRASCVLGSLQQQGRAAHPAEWGR